MTSVVCYLVKSLVQRSRNTGAEISCISFFYLLYWNCKFYLSRYVFRIYENCMCAEDSYITTLHQLQKLISVKSGDTEGELKRIRR